MSNDYLEIPTRTTGQPNSAADYNQGGINERATRLAAIASPGATLFLTSAHNRVQELSPSANEFVVMPSDGIKAGERVEIFNVSDTYTLDPINDASDGNSLGLITPLTRVIFSAKQDNPTEATHWRTVAASGDWFNAGLVAGSFTGYGTPTGIISYGKRQDGDLLMRIKFASGISTAVEGRIALAFGLISSSQIMTVERCGDYVSDGSIAADNRAWFVTMEPSVAYTTTSQNASGSNTFIKINGDTWLSNGNTVAAIYRVPIGVWALG